MKKVVLGVFALALGFMVSSFTTKTTLNEKVWFDDESASGYAFFDFKTTADMQSTYGFSTSGTLAQRVVLGYDQSREDEAFTVDSRSGSIIEAATLITSNGVPAANQALYDVQ